MIKCTIQELQHTAKAMALLLGGYVKIVESPEGHLYYFVIHGDNTCVGCEKGLTSTMKALHWEDRFKSDKCYVYPEYIKETEELDMRDIEHKYQLLAVVRERHCRKFE